MRAPLKSVSVALSASFPASVAADSGIIKPSVLTTEVQQFLIDADSQSAGTPPEVTFLDENGNPEQLNGPVRLSVSYEEDKDDPDKNSIVLTFKESAADPDTAKSRVIRLNQADVQEMGDSYQGYIARFEKRIRENAAEIAETEQFIAEKRGAFDAWQPKSFSDPAAEDLHNHMLEQHYDDVLYNLKEIERIKRVSADLEKGRGAIHNDGTQWLYDKMKAGGVVLDEWHVMKGLFSLTTLLAIKDGDRLRTLLPDIRPDREIRREPRLSRVMVVFGENNQGPR